MYTDIHIHIRLYVCMYACMHVCMHMHMHMHVNMHMHMYMYVCIHVCCVITCMCVCMYVCMHVLIVSRPPAKCLCSIPHCASHQWSGFLGDSYTRDSRMMSSNAQWFSLEATTIYTFISSISHKKYSYTHQPILTTLAHLHGCLCANCTPQDMGPLLGLMSRPSITIDPRWNPMSILYDGPTIVSVWW